MNKDEALRLALEALETSMYPQQKQLQAITAIKAALEAKDEPVQEPWESEMRNELVALGFDGQCPESIGITLKRWRDGYAAPQRKPLSFEQVEDCFPDEAIFSEQDGWLRVSAQTLHDIARNVEAAHGITGDNNG